MPNISAPGRHGLRLPGAEWILAQDVAGLHAGAGLHQGVKRPASRAIQLGHARTARDEIAILAADGGQGPLDAVEHAAQQAGAELHLERGAGGLDRVIGPQAGGVLVDLDGRARAVQPDNLANELLAAENLDLVTATLALSDTLTLRSSVGGANTYQVVERGTASVYEIEALSQRRAGLTLVLLGGNEESPDRRIVVWAVPIEERDEE